MEKIKKSYPTRGFGSMDVEKARIIQRQGGKTAHERGTAHEFTSEEAQAAGRIGGRNKGRNFHERKKLLV